MPGSDRRIADQADRSMVHQKNGEAHRHRDGKSPNSVPTPARGGRPGARERHGTALEELMRKRGVDEAWTALEEMQQHGATTDKYTVSRMLMKTVGDSRSRLNPTRVYRAIGIAEKFIEMQPNDVDEVLVNALLDTCCRLKDLTRLESIMQRMRALQITPSPVTLGILVKTYGQAGDIAKVLQVWSEMDKQRGEANAVTYGCMIDACVKCNHLHKAVEVFEGMRESGKHRNTIIYTTLIKGFGLEKNLGRALELFREMPRENVPYNTITYNSAIDACVKCGDLKTAETLLREVTSPSSPLEPDLITFSTLLKGYCQIGDIDTALQLCEAIKARGLRVDELVYNTLMDGCVKANDVTAGVGLFEEMVHNGMRPSAITHSILVRLYQRAGYEDDASEAVVQLYNHHGIERPVGGERRQGAGRRNGNQRTPGTSPTASPMSGYGMHQGEGCWGAWNEYGYDGHSNASGVSTPCGTPMRQPLGHGNCMMLPMDAMASVPALPGMGGQEASPYGTPMSSGHGSYAGTPCMSPNQGAMSTVSQMVPAAPGAGMPSLPAWPFSTGAAPGTMPGAAMGAYNTMPSFPQGGNMMATTSPNAASMTNSAVSQAPCMPGEASPSWQGQAEVAQRTPFPMPLSPPHDLAQNCTPSQPQQAFFQCMPDSGQGNQPVNPFCL